MRPLWRITALVASAALAFLATACARAGDTGFTDAEGAVRDYNGALIQAYRMSDPSGLSPFATEKEVGKIRVLIDIKTSGRLVLESTLESLQVTSATSTPGAMTVETRERWRYFDRNLDPGKAPGTVFVADMALRYNFVKAGGSWKMDQGETLSSRYLEPEGFIPNPPGPGNGGAKESPAPGGEA